MTNRTLTLTCPLVCAVLLVACGTSPPQGTEPAETAAAPAPAAPPLESPVSINSEMVAVVDHAGHELWQVEKAGAKAAIDWANVEHHAIQLAAAGALIKVAGTGVNDRDWVRSPGWTKWAQAMSDAGLAARTAAQQRNREALVAANGRLVDACEGCHKEFKPDLPSEGITHVHAH